MEVFFSFLLDGLTMRIIIDMFGSEFTKIITIRNRYKNLKEDLKLVI